MTMSMPNAPDAVQLTPEQEYRFDLDGYFVLKDHYAEDVLKELHAGIDDLQALPIDYKVYSELGVGHPAGAKAMQNPEHSVWKKELPENREGKLQRAGIGRVDHALCGTDKFDHIVRDAMLKSIHMTFAGGPVYVSASYFIEKIGPSAGGRLHNGGYPVDRDIYYAYDHTNGRFACRSTKSVIILSDMSRIENGPFAAIPGSHKSNFVCPYDTTDATKNPMAVPVFAKAGDVIIFSEGMTHNAYPVVNRSIRRSVFFNYMPSIGRNNLPNQRMSIYPERVIERLADQADILTCPGYI